MFGDTKNEHGTLFLTKNLNKIKFENPGYLTPDWNSCPTLPTINYVDCIGPEIRFWSKMSKNGPNHVDDFRNHTRRIFIRVHYL